MGINIYWIAIVLILALVHKALPGQGLKKGLCFGIGIWIISNLAGAVPSALYLNINSTVPIYWVVSGLIQMLIVSTIIAVIYKEE
ncbi:MAG: hypothetical protein QME57_05365 [Patescibacteria group bacterium]|nr:hypothetical protein [Patescibacteria group bacterium]